MYYALIMNYYNNVVRIEERPTYERAEKAGQFYAKKIKNGWWIVVDKDSRDIHDLPNGVWK